MSLLPEVSVVVSTHDRAHLLPAAIDSILAQEPGTPPFELIVVDNNSTDNTAQVVNRYANRPEAEVRYVFEGRQGVSHGRNAGILAARGQYIAITDDDIRVAPNWVANVKRAFDEYPSAAFVGGKVLPEWGASPPRWLTAAHWSPLALVDYGDAPVEVSEQRPICLVTANVAFRREVFDRFGLFDPTYQHTPGSAAAIEDEELEMRIRSAGDTGMYVPGLVVTAAVPPARLKKRYHRKWHADHAAAYARLYRLGTENPLEGVGSPTVLGTPGWVFGQLVRAAARWAAALLRGRPGAAFGHEVSAREAVGIIRYCVAQFRASPGRRGVASELVAAGRSLLRRRRPFRGTRAGATAT